MNHKLQKVFIKKSSKVFWFNFPLRLIVCLLVCFSFIHLPLSLAAITPITPITPVTPVSRCPATTLSISTGWNHATNTVYPVGSWDDYWTVVSQPAGFGGSLPRPTNVIVLQSGWALQLTNSQWLGAHPGSINATNGEYVFERKFCVADTKDIQLTMQILVDDDAKVYLNGTNLIGQTPIGPSSCPGCNFQLPALTIATTNAALFVLGTNTLKIVVTNRWSRAMGLDISGSVTGNLIRQECCDSKGALGGYKWNDLNGDGIWQSTEPMLANWPILLSNGMTTTTDQYGYYFFMEVPTGTYTVTEGPKAGWVQTYPTTPGSYTVILANNQIINSLNFGNQIGSTGQICICKFNDLNGDGRQEAGEGPLVNWAFNVTGNNFSGTIKTDAKGCGCLTVPAPGTYTVTEVGQAGWTVTTNNNPSTVTVAAGGTVNLLFGNYKKIETGQLCVEKFNDLNGNGVQDIGEPLLGGWVFNVTGSNNFAGTITSSETGCSCACLTVPAPGSYTITEVEQTGWTLTTVNPQTVSMAIGQTEKLLFGNKITNGTGQICICKFNDLNGNGVQEAGEAPLVGWMFNVNGQSFSGTITTDAKGCGCLTVPGGTYTVTEIGQPGWTLTTTNVGNKVFVTGGQTVNLLFGNKKSSCIPICQGCIKKIIPDPQVNNKWEVTFDPDCNASTNNDMTYYVTDIQVYTELKAILEKCSEIGSSGSKIWTTDDDFIEGTSMSVNHGSDAWTDPHSGQGSPNDQLQMTIPGSTFPFIWVPNDKDGTVSLLATQTTIFNTHSIVAGTEYGRYLTGPTNNGNPSRTTVDLYGNCWVANRNTDTVIKILNRFIMPIVDINTPLDGVQTSPGSSYLAWGKDDAVVWEVDLGVSPGVFRPGAQPLTDYTNSPYNQILRATSIDRNNDLWVGSYGGTNSNNYYHIRYNVTGIPVIPVTADTFPNVPSYGSVIDRCGFIYVTNYQGITRIDPSNGSKSYVPYVNTYISANTYLGYGIAIDNELANRVYTTDYSHGKIYAWDTSNWPISMAAPIAIGNTVESCSGLTVSKDGIWVANTWGNKIMLFDKTIIPGPPGTPGILSLINSLFTNIGSDPVLNPKGVAVDSEGHCWIVGQGSSAVREYQLISSTITQIGPSYNVINSGNSHYAYSDMTGLMANSIAAQHGIWTATYEAPCNDPIWTASWNVSTPKFTSLHLSFFTSDDNNNWGVGTPTSIVGPASPSTSFVSLTTHQKYIKVEVEFLSNPPCDTPLEKFPTPVLKDITVNWTCKGGQNNNCCVYACLTDGVIWNIDEQHVGQNPCCGSSGGRILGTVKGNCSPGTIIQISDQTTGQVVWTGSTDSTSSYDTGTDCKLICGETYKVEPLQSSGCTITPLYQIITISHCCPPTPINPGYETVNFKCDCQPHKGRIQGLVKGKCNPVTIKIEGLGTTNYSGTFTTDSYTGFYQTSPGGNPPIRCILPCPGKYRVTPVPVNGVTFVPSYVEIDMKECCEDSVSYEADFICTDNIGDSIGQICIKKFNDLNGNGVQDPSESQLAGWNFTVHNQSTGIDYPIESAVLDWACVKIPAGTYTVTEVGQAGWTVTTNNNPSTVTVAAGGTVNLLFGNYKKIEAGQLWVEKFNDLNGNGVQDIGEPLLGGWVFNITGPNNFIGTITSLESGGAFLSVPAGIYTVTEVMQTGWTSTKANPQIVNVVEGQTASLVFMNHLINSPGGPKLNPLILSDQICSGSEVAVDESWTGGVAPFTWVVNYGDGTPSINGSSTGNRLIVRHLYAVVGLYTIKVMVTDSNGKTDSIAQTISVVDCEVKEEVYHHTFFIGYPDGLFKPERNVSRAEVAAALSRALGLGWSNTKPSYPDVSSTHWATGYIQIMTKEGIMEGDVSGTFRPDAYITRAEAAAVFLRMLKIAPFNNLITSSFRDVVASNWAIGYIESMQRYGLITGYPDGTYKPSANIVRSEFAAIADRSLGREISDSSQVTGLGGGVRWPDVPLNHWAYLYILEASTPHTVEQANRLNRNIVLRAKTIPLFSDGTSIVTIHRVGDVLTAIVPVDGLQPDGTDPAARRVVVRITTLLAP
ncbi:MAG TPA: S-layer homology domain-containing protein [Candidatus Cryosericum sp.]